MELPLLKKILTRISQTYPQKGHNKKANVLRLWNHKYKSTLNKNVDSKYNVIQNTK